MKAAVSTARVLVATDNVDDAQQILKQLESDFQNVRSSTNPDLYVPDFEEYRPDVLVLAFDSIDKAQRYYLGLYRLGSSAPQHIHRTVILCGKEEVRVAFDLCKREYFDDYVLYWPHTFDGPRLAMSIWIACREMLLMRSRLVQPKELLLHASQVRELDQSIDDEYPAVAVPAVAPPGATRGAVERDPVADWARQFKQRMQPALAGAIAMGEKAAQARKIVMVVEDDDFACRLVTHTLDPSEWQIVFATNGSQALAQLRRVLPDVILMDLRLPDTDGVTLTRQLKASAHLAAIPIIMVTGDSRRATLVGSMEAGAAAFVVKPFTRESLLSNLLRVLAR